jgi:acyl-CoA synthetase (NDP forming)
MLELNTEIRKINIAAMLNAKSLAIVGISGQDRFGGQIYANLQLLGYEGKIFGVNPRYETLYDQKIYSSLSDLPEVPDWHAVISIQQQQTNLIIHSPFVKLVLSN